MNFSINLPFQPELCPAFPTVYGSCDYHNFKRQLEHIDSLICKTKLRERFTQISVEHETKRNPAFTLSQRFLNTCEQVLYCNIALILTGDSFRDFSLRLADSHLLQRFCKLITIDGIKAPSKSTLQRYANWLGENDLHTLLHTFLESCIHNHQDIGLQNPLDFDHFYADSTCVETNIHFPVDWVLLIDAVRTLTKATTLIRNAGLKNRMDPPESFLSAIQQHGMAMTAQTRKKDSKKKRKALFRQMKSILNTVKKHAIKHRNLLETQSAQTDLTPAQCTCILSRIDNIVAQLPNILEQGQARIIRGEKVPNDQKTLSLYEPDTQIIVRGKAGKQVEFGNQLTLVEQSDGLIAHWDFHQELTSDKTQVLPIHEALAEHFTVQSLHADRGYDSAKNQKYLLEQNCYNGLTPKSPLHLEKRLEEPAFVEGQKRRSQTEARIGIFKNVFLGKNHRLRTKGFVRRSQRIGNSVLAHNLWVIARKLQEQEKLLDQAA